MLTYCKVQQKAEATAAEIEWDEDSGSYNITYYTSDKAKVEIKINAGSGEPVKIR